MVFKDYDPNQLMLLPQNLGDLLPSNHPCRTISNIVDRINIKPILSHYSALGASSYHPKMLLKVLIYGYLDNCYSSRKLEKAVMENIPFMWLAGMQRPDHNTINRFRGEKLRDVIRGIFSQVVLMLYDEGLVDIKDVYTDGTKIEANANSYTFVWGKSIKKSRERDRQAASGAIGLCRRGGKPRIGPSRRRDSQGPQQLFKDGYGCYLYENEGRPYGKRSAQARVQPSDKYQWPICSQLHTSPKAQ